MVVPPNGWFRMENFIYKWMIWGYHPFLGNLHIIAILFSFVDERCDCRISGKHVKNMTTCTGFLGHPGSMARKI